MPVYDYKCSNCSNTFSVMVSVRNKEGIKCPRCGGQKLKQAFTVKGSAGKSREPVVPPRCG